MRPHNKTGTYGFSAHQACFYLHCNYPALKKMRPLELFIKTLGNSQISQLFEKLQALAELQLSKHSWNTYCPEQREWCITQCRMFAHIPIWESKGKPHPTRILRSLVARLLHFQRRDSYWVLTAHACMLLLREQRLREKPLSGLWLRVSVS